MTGVEGLACSNGLLGDAEALRRRLAEDGYLFFSGLLPAGQIGAAAVAVFNQLRQGGWADNQGAASGRPRALTVRDALEDGAFRAAIASPAFNQIPYLGQVRRVVRMILGPRAFSYPSKVLRAVHPEHPGHAAAAPAPAAKTDPAAAAGRVATAAAQARARPAAGIARGRYIHQDYGVGGVQDMLTTWVPLIDIPVRLGGLAVLPGSHLGPPLRPRVLSPREHGWATTSYHAGDVLVFHSLTSHAALPNLSTSLRLSGDFRWQRPDQPAPAQLVLGPGSAGRRPGTSMDPGPAGGRPEMFSRLLRREPWWEPVPAGLTLVPRESMVAVPPGPSRFFPVHAGWKHWRPPPG